MPQAPHIERHFTASNLVRDIVIGMSDGLTVPFALAAGLSGAVNTTNIILTAGLAEITNNLVVSIDYDAGRSNLSKHLPPQARKELKEVGWTKGLELAKLARRDGQQFDCATWLHKARSLPKDQFKREVEKELTGRESEPWEIIYFKLYKTQIPVVEQAIETAALMLGTDKSRGYCLEMICADFLAGANLDHGNPDVLLHSVSRMFKFLPRGQKQTFIEELNQSA